MDESDEVTVTFDLTPEGMPASFGMRFSQAMEMLQLAGMCKWESTAPLPGRVGLRGGEEIENSQQARLQFLLEGVGKAAGNADDIYSELSLRTRSDRTGHSKITASEPDQGLPLSGKWWLDCCLNKDQKLAIVSELIRFGYSREYVQAASRFVAGEPVFPDAPTGSGGTRAR